LVTRAAMFAALLHDVWHSRQAWIPFPLVADVNGYWPHATDMVVHGRVPYVDFAYEYPPGSLPLLAVARMVGRTQVHFVIAWLLLMLVLDLVAVVVLDRWPGGIRAGHGSGFSASPRSGRSCWPATTCCLPSAWSSRRTCCGAGGLWRPGWHGVSRS
jgi:hypothetical protein